MAEPTTPHPPVDGGERDGWMTVEETARRIGHYKWTEMRLFEVLGGWVATVPELDVTLRLGTHCYHHAWHAELWHRRLAELGRVDPERLTVPPNDRYEAFIAALGQPAGPEQTLERLVGLYRVLLPRLIATYAHHRRATSEVSDAATRRSLRFCLQDDLEGWQEGEELIQALLTTPDDVERAAAHQARLEALLVAAGGVAGPGSTGPAPSDDQPAGA